ncbi:hypothetical protein JAAARDRAFT_55720 [Jaapia argillacea MUCL 33604]|uniref:Uncharacterized protein n=1 Tax=Jaapia argillacea MUCL 33604 TaxID=933084 RepID=A0A067QEH1_9AGAM|nr:hypothetical protein JAAARDRAFT_55720 [Jaapia argillacea MUCL 33604]
MRPLEPYPSFTLVITQSQHPSDLMAYRNSRRKRQRSYPSSMLFQDPLMMTVDYRDQHPQAFPTLSWGGTLSNEEAIATFSLDAALQTRPDKQATPGEGRVKRLSLTTLVIVCVFSVLVDFVMGCSSLLQDLALAVRRRCQNVLNSGKADST